MNTEIEMGIFTNIFRRSKDEPTEQRYIGGLSFGSFSSYSQSQAQRIATVYCATNKISNAVASLPVNIYTQEGGKKKKIAHPLNFVLNSKPNTLTNRYNFLKMIVESVIYKGAGYALIERDNKLIVKSLTFIDADFVVPVIQKDGTMKYQINGKSELVDACNVLDFHMHADTTGKGISVIKYAADSLGEMADIQRHTSKFFRGNCSPTTILKVPGNLRTDQAKELMESWSDAFTSPDKIGVAILQGGIDSKQIQLSPADAKLLETRQFDVVEICRFFQISPLEVFDYSNSNNSSMESARISFLADTVQPYLSMMEAEMNIKLFKPSEIGKMAVEFDVGKALRTDKQSEANYYHTLLTSGILSLNEVRERLGYEAIADGDKHYMQLSYTTIDKINNAEIKQKPIEGVDNNAKSNKE